MRQEKTTPGLLIVCDGNNGSFKTSSIKKIAEHLTSEGYDVVCTAEPGGTEVGMKIRTLARSPEIKGMAPLTNMLLFAAARAQNVVEIIEPALQKGCVILVDRWSMSSRIFQGLMQGLDPAIVDKIDSLARGGIEPDFTLVFDLDPRIGLRRVQRRGLNDDKFESAEIEMLDRVRQGYLDDAASRLDEYAIIDASADPESVFRSTIREVDAFLARKGYKP